MFVLHFIHPKRTDLTCPRIGRQSGQGSARVVHPPGHWQAVYRFHEGRCRCLYRGSSGASTSYIPIL